MAPLRRYLRITPSSVLEVRIYPSPPGPWLLSTRSLLTRVLAAVRPLILPKLREENERVKARGRGRGVKDVVSGDGFEVSVFLTETSTRHTVLKRRKIFREPERKEDTNPDAPAPLLREEDGDDDVVIQDVPPETESSNQPPPTRRSKRTRPTEDTDTLFVADSDASISSASDSDAGAPPAKRARSAAPLGGAEEEEQDEKKMAMRSEYDGYGIYGRVLCLIVTKTAVKDVAGMGGREVMEEWIASTQNPAGEAT
ncbi:hypothetical protein VE01_07597 [Pseudogymnoascus verrucosus]|uniref:Uncharacterized protein n=1 Tax=Pseudogymnoascus verrucosus TaxID=342668 RepID=A0A1B8GH63_9PEZI|nr:uncharacterized protein VE01_07597 [Pseudogymnoascus verrucosus]OBT95164.1 hypothetical protein VE01_07597 [Pseudogymnoascus verrucosus]